MYIYTCMGNIPNDVYNVSLATAGTHTDVCTYKDSDDCTHSYYLSLTLFTVLVDDDRGTIYYVVYIIIHF